ncbi:hypothetical protein FRACYDRAFT_235968 [Fragilariopsis cylindrus CCMP1102]|uniref:JmjC domain-containing protein n=1 Tax=Fragilariopsis cylindrus CCMP1102 TaxID=635003 RepID=A0A1E7FQ27_9STRA|nr:hypothetical protein FRACYDRAFT_235968 [Fragilariopsis cylindrus CCMP1102]|eukprot:OEU19903.1 hypothetical protein FRACYDRAFT_235968 [Fragilariopsis cylindrus CCMP1102]
MRHRHNAVTDDSDSNRDDEIDGCAGGLVCLIFLFIDDGDLSYLELYFNNITTTTTTTANTMSSKDLFLKAVLTTDTEKIDKEEISSSSSSSVYKIPHSMPHIGDKSDIYARLRQDWDERYHPDNPERSLLVVRKARRESIYNRLIAPPLPPPPPPLALDSSSSSNIQNDDDNNYDIYNCPDYPPPRYPREYKTIDILQHWPPTQSLPLGGYDSNERSENSNERESESATIMAHLGVCVFDYSNDYRKILRYRSKEVPFVVRNDPSVANTVERWNDENYRRKLFGGLDHTGSDSDSDSDSHNNNDNNSDVINDEKNNDRKRTIYHRAERAVTNQILFRQQRKRRPPPINTYDTISNQKKKEKTTNYDNLQEKPLPPPTKLISMTYEKWYNLAKKKENKVNISSTDGIQYYDTNQIRDKSSYYYYFRLVGCGEKKDCETNSTEYLFDELPFFQPRRSNEISSDKQQRRKKKRRGRRGRQRQEREEPTNDDQLLEEEEVPSLYLVDPDQQKGIHCRFGMPGMIAANHYDASRNTIAILGGTRRYILSRPEQCPNMGLFPMKHPSARHSKVDWTTASTDYYNGKNDDNDNDDDVEEAENNAFTSSSSGLSWKEYKESLSLLANNATSTEVILEAGDVLYLPSYWFHFIISLDVNMQCNTRSGHCGFPPQAPK